LLICQGKITLRLLLIQARLGADDEWRGKLRAWLTAYELPDNKLRVVML
jgi:hypothetical protein